jgi:hypothetical protein
MSHSTKEPKSMAPTPSTLNPSTLNHFTEEARSTTLTPLIIVVLFATLFAQQSAWADDSIYTFWQANESSNQIFYSASYDGTDWFSYDEQTFSQSINSADSTSATPAAAAYNDKLYVVWKASDPSNRIYYSASSDGNIWPDGQPINSVDSTSAAPAVVAFDEKLYVFWKASDPSNRIYYSVSSDGKNWSGGQTINNVDSTSATPALTTDGNKLYVFWRENGSNNIYYSASSDGITWPDQGNQVKDQNNNAITSTTAPAATYNKDLGGLYLVWKVSDGSNQIFYSTSSDGSAWTPQLLTNKSNITSTAPAASVYNDSVYIAWRDLDSSSIYYTASDDGKTWPDGNSIARIASNGSTLAAPALAAPFSPDLSYNFECDATDNSGFSWATSKCCHPDTEYCGTDGAENFSTGHDNKDPYSGSLNPQQKLQLNIVCSQGRKTEVSTHNFKHNDSIKCSHSQDVKGTKIYQCQNNSNDNHHTWHLEGYKCGN